MRNSNETFKIQYWKLETFNRKLNTSIGFLRNTWKPLFRALASIAAPPFVLGVAIMVFYFDVVLQNLVVENYDMGLLWSFIAYFFVGNLLVLLALLMVALVTFEVVRISQENPKELYNTKLIFKRIRKKIWKMIALTLIVGFAYGIVTVLSFFLSMLGMLLLLVFFALLYLIYPIAYYEKTSVFSSIGKGIDFLKSSFLQSVGMFFGSYIIWAVLISGVLIPILQGIYFLTISGNFDEGEFYTNKLYFALLMLLFFFFYAGILITNIFHIVNASVLYFSVKEKVEGNYTMQQIEQFDQIDSEAV